MPTIGPLHPDDSRATRATLFLRLRPDADGREMAWREFHDRYAPIIAGFARKMSVPEQDVSDLVQDVLAGFFAASPKFAYDPARGRFRGYLKTCVWHVFQKRLGERLRLGDRRVTEVDPADVGVEQVWNDVWESEKLQRAMEIVRERYAARPERAKTWQAFEMATLLDRPTDDVAAELAMPLDSVHQARTRVSKAIRAAMEEIDGGE